MTEIRSAYTDWSYDRSDQELSLTLILLTLMLILVTLVTLLTLTIVCYVRLHRVQE